MLNPKRSQGLGFRVRGGVIVVMVQNLGRYMSYSLSSLKGSYIGVFIGNSHRGYRGGYKEFRLWLI